MPEIIVTYILRFSIVLISIYSLLNLGIILGRFLLKHPVSREKSNLKFSIVIPVRNELSNIEHIVNDLIKQNYCVDDFEIIIVDDHSEDETTDLINTIVQSNLKLITNIGQGKKAAVYTGVKSATMDYIVQIDADCRVGADYLKTISYYLETNKVKLLAAPVLFESGTTFFSKFQELEFLSLLMSTMGLIGIRKAVMVNGANLIYPKSIFTDAEILNSKSVSGDDVFLLHHVKKTYGKKSVHFLKSKEATVVTSASKDFGSFLNQRIRWASKSKYYKDLDTLLIGSIIFITNLFLVCLFFLSFIDEALVIGFVLAFIIKMSMDYFLLMPIVKQYKKYALLVYFPLLSFIYPFYVSFVGITSPFAKFEWKNRKY